MADITDEIEITLPEEGALPETEVKVEVEPEAKGSKRSEVPELEALKQQLEEERAARRAAEGREREARTEVTRKDVEVQDTNLSLVTNAISTVEAQIAAAKRKYIDARSVGDAESEADASFEMSSLAGDLKTLKQGQQQMKSQPRREEPADPVEAFASRLAAPSANWVRKHPEYVTDARKNAKMQGAHQMVIGDGIAADTDEYFAAVERLLGIETAVPDHRNSREGPRRHTPPAAPPSRTTSPGVGRSNVVRLSADEREIAKMNGMTDHEYAASKLALQKEGKLN